MSKQMTLRSIRVDRVLTVPAVAEACGVHPDTVWAWETGKRFPNVPKIIKLQECLHCHFEDIKWRI